MRRCVISIVLCLMLGACTSMTGPSTQQRFYVDSDVGRWLTPKEREFVTCADGRVLECSKGIGRLSSTWCLCVGPRRRTSAADSE
jgi:hypothetical protein